MNARLEPSTIDLPGAPAASVFAHEPAPVASAASVGGSLKVALTRRLVVGLVLIGVLGAAVAYAAATHFATRAYDRSLFDSVQMLAKQVRWRDGTMEVALSADVIPWLLSDEGDDVTYRVSDLSTGRVLTANGELGALPDAAIPEGEPYFRSVAVGTETIARRLCQEARRTGRRGGAGRDRRDAAQARERRPRHPRRNGLDDGADRDRRRVAGLERRRQRARAAARARGRGRASFGRRPPVARSVERADRGPRADRGDQSHDRSRRRCRRRAAPVPRERRASAEDADRRPAAAGAARVEGGSRGPGARQHARGRAARGAQRAPDRAAADARARRGRRRRCCPHVRARWPTSRPT